MLTRSALKNRTSRKSNEGGDLIETEVSSTFSELTPSQGQQNGSTRNRKNGNGNHDGAGRQKLSFHQKTLPLSERMMRSFSGLYCAECATQPFAAENEEESSRAIKNGSSVSTPLSSQQQQSFDELNISNLLRRKNSSVSPLILQPMMHSTLSPEGIEGVLSEYVSACRFYGCGDRINSGVLTALRFQLPAVRVSESFHDADMLALGEILFRHCNGALKYVQRLDFSISSTQGKKEGAKFCGFRSHGAFTLSKVLQSSEYIREVRLSRHRIGPYGASALFLAVSTNPTLQVLDMRGCRVGERGALAFAEYVCRSKECGLYEVDLSANRIGYHGSKAIEKELKNREEDHVLHVDMEGNLVFQEIMNCVTHGLGIILGIAGSMLLSNKVKDKSFKHVMSCAVYSTSLVVLYTSSTLYHSFFSLQATKYIFEVFDKCAIYILIAGSYTPFCQIIFGDTKLWSVHMQTFVWVCAFSGILVEAFAPTWERKLFFSLAMYLSMGWTALVGLQDMIERLPTMALNLLVLGGVAYTAGVPFFVRNNNLDHSIWHMFVLAGSTLHWFVIYCYVADHDFDTKQHATIM